MARKSTKTTDDSESQAKTTRGIWSGSISFGLLQIPVSLVTAEERGEEIHFRQLDKRDLSPIRYDRVNSTSGKPVEWKDIVKGYEVSHGEFVIVEPSDLKKANVKATQTIDIQDFVSASDIDPVFFETPYYVVPQARAHKAYVLLRQALEKKGAVAIATFVLRTREHLVALMPVDDAIILEVMRFGHELREAPAVRGTAKESIGARELAMAEQLIDGMMTDWDPKKYRDRYFDDVVKLIEEKAKTGKVKAHNEPEPSSPKEMVDLLALLKKSVAANDGGPRKTRHGRGKSKAA